MIQMMKKYNNSNNTINIDDITEYLYDIEVKKDDMIDDIYDYSSFIDLLCNKILYKKTYNPLIILIKFILMKMIPNIEEQIYNLNTIKTKYIMNNLTKDQLIEAYDAIVQYENKKFPAKSYKDYYMKITGIKTCSTCSNPMVRIHEDFQRIILNLIKRDHPGLMTFKLQLKSGKYNNAFYNDNVPFYTISKIGQLMNQIKAQAAGLKFKGYIDQVDILNHDIAQLEALYQYRTSALGSFKQPLQPSIVQSNVSVPAEEISVENEALIESLNEDNLMEHVAEHLSEVLNTEIKVVEVVDESEALLSTPTLSFNVPTTLQEAWELKLAGHKLSVIAQSMGTSHQALSKQFRTAGLDNYCD